MFIHTHTGGSVSSKCRWWWVGECLTEFKVKAIRQIGCMCMFSCPPSSVQSKQTPLSRKIPLLQYNKVTFEINTKSFVTFSQNQKERNFVCNGSDCYLLLPASLFLIQVSLLTQSQMLQGLTDPPPLHPTLIRNHMT